MKKLATRAQMCTYAPPKSTKPRPSARKCVHTPNPSPQNQVTMRANVDLHPTQVHKTETKCALLCTYAQPKSTNTRNYARKCVLTHHPSPQNRGTYIAIEEQTYIGAIKLHVNKLRRLQQNF